MTDAIQDVLLILAAGLVAALACRRIGISPLLGYLLAGAVLGPGVLGWVSDKNHEIEHIAEAGVFLLLFSIGLEFSLDELAALGRSLLVGGSVQMALVAVPAGVVLWLVGHPTPAVILMSSALAFSSTVLVFKGLAETGHSTTKAGRRAIGILLFQDAALVPLLLLVPLLTQNGKIASWWDYVLLTMNSALFIGSIVVVRLVLRRWIVPALAGFRSPELVVLFTLVLLGGVTLAAYRIGLPPALGAFAAGLILSGYRWTAQMDALVLPFRESFAAIFFVSLGLLFEADAIGSHPVEMVAAFLLLLVGKIVAALVALKLTGLSWRSSFGLSLGLAHVGEFAFVLLLLGLDEGLVERGTYQKFVALAFGTLLLTPLLLKWGLRYVGDTQRDTQPTTYFGAQAVRSALVVGVGPGGRQGAAPLDTTGLEVHLVDRSAVNLYPFAQQGFHTVAGDATDHDILEAAGASKAALVIVCVPDDKVALEIVRLVRTQTAEAMVVVRCRFQASESTLLKAGANVVVNEETQVSRKLSSLLEKGMTHDTPPG